MTLNWSVPLASYFGVKNNQYADKPEINKFMQFERQRSVPGTGVLALEAKTNRQKFVTHATEQQDVSGNSIWNVFNDQGQYKSFVLGFENLANGDQNLTLTDSNPAKPGWGDTSNYNMGLVKFGKIDLYNAQQQAETGSLGSYKFGAESYELKADAERANVYNVTMPGINGADTHLEFEVKTDGKIMMRDESTLGTLENEVQLQEENGSYRVLDNDGKSFEFIG